MSKAPKKKAAAKKGPTEKVVVQKIVDPQVHVRLYKSVHEQKPWPILKDLVQEQGADPNYIFPHMRFTPLFRAIELNSIQHIETLLYLKANPNHRDAPKLKGEEDPVGGAAAKAKAKAAPKKGAQQPTAKKEAQKKTVADPSTMRAPRMPPEPIFNGGSALHVAIQLGHYHIVKRLLNVDKEGNAGPEKCDVNIQNKRLQTPLWLACSEGKPEIVKLLIKANAEFTRDIEGRSNFMITAINGHSTMCKILLKYKPQCWEGSDDSFKTGTDGSLVKVSRSIFDYLPSLVPGVVNILLTLRHPLTKDELSHYGALKGGITQYTLETGPTQAGSRMHDPESSERKETALMRALMRIFTVDILVVEQNIEKILQLFKSGEAARQHLECENSSNQNILHICFGAQIIITDEEYEEYNYNLRQEQKKKGGNGLDKGKRDSRDDKIADQKMKGWLTKEVIWELTPKDTVALRADKLCRERMCVGLFENLVHAAHIFYPRALEKKDGRDKTPLDYAKLFGGEDYVRKFSRVHDALARPISAGGASTVSTRTALSSREQKTPRKDMKYEKLMEEEGEAEFDKRPNSIKKY